MGRKVQCKLCGDVIESKYRHDFVRCKCGDIFVDGGNDYLRMGSETDIHNAVLLPNDAHIDKDSSVKVKGE